MWPMLKEPRGARSRYVPVLSPSQVDLDDFVGAVTNGRAEQNKSDISRLDC